MENSSSPMNNCRAQGHCVNPGRPVRHTFQILSRLPGLCHGVFTRHGGVSRPPYASLNVGWSNGDQPEAVRHNLNLVRNTLGLKSLLGTNQLHGATIHVIDASVVASAKASTTLLQTLPGDALVTRLRGIGLLIKIADCQAVFLVDPVREVIANVHCGWRGNVGNILGKTVRVLEGEFGCRPADLLAAISPSLGPCCAEFRDFRRELPEAFWDCQPTPTYFDWWAISRRQLLEAGLQPHNIEFAGRCTVCEQEHFFSYRAEKMTGRMAAVIGWEKT
jgi:polyphenol oxidase